MGAWAVHDISLMLVYCITSHRIRKHCGNTLPALLGPRCCTLNFLALICLRNHAAHGTCNACGPAPEVHAATACHTGQAMQDSGHAAPAFTRPCGHPARLARGFQPARLTAQVHVHVHIASCERHGRSQCRSVWYTANPQPWAKSMSHSKQAFDTTSAWQANWLRTMPLETGKGRVWVLGKGVGARE